MKTLIIVAFLLSAVWSCKKKEDCVTVNCLTRQVQFVPYQEDTLLTSYELCGDDIRPVDTNYVVTQGVKNGNLYEERKKCKCECQ